MRIVDLVKFPKASARCAPCYRLVLPTHVPDDLLSLPLLDFGWLFVKESMSAVMGCAGVDV